MTKEFFQLYLFLFKFFFIYSSTCLLDYFIFYKQIILVYLPIYFVNLFNLFIDLESYHLINSFSMADLIEISILASQAYTVTFGRVEEEIERVGLGF